MDHDEAVQMMATERYLLGEMPAEMRAAFEEHFFDCPECAEDLRAEAAFVREAKVQLASFPQAAGALPARPSPPRNWFGWLRPAFAVPAFAALLALVGYQNLSTIPSLRSAASQPHLAPWATLHVGTRGGASLPVIADHKSGAVILIDVPDTGACASFAFSLADPQGKEVWTQTTVPSSTENNQQTLSLLIPGMGLQPGAYTLTISGITTQGSRTQLDRRILDVRFDE